MNRSSSNKVDQYCRVHTHQRGYTHYDNQRIYPVENLSLVFIEVLLSTHPFTLFFFIMGKMLLSGILGLKPLTRDISWYASHPRPSVVCGHVRIIFFMLDWWCYDFCWPFSRWETCGAVPTLPSMVHWQQFLGLHLRLWKVVYSYTCFMSFPEVQV